MARLHQTARVIAVSVAIRHFQALIVAGLVDNRLSTDDTVRLYFQFFQETDLANSPQAKKRARQAETRRTRNAGMRSMMRTHVKRVVAAIDSGDKTAASDAYTAAIPVLDSMARKGLVHKNKAARYKSRLNAQIRAL